MRGRGLGRGGLALVARGDERAGRKDGPRTGAECADDVSGCLGIIGLGSLLSNQIRDQLVADLGATAGRSALKSKWKAAPSVLADRHMPLSHERLPVRRQPSGPPPLSRRLGELSEAMASESDIQDVGLAAS